MNSVKLARLFFCVLCQAAFVSRHIVSQTSSQRFVTKGHTKEQEIMRAM